MISRKSQLIGGYIDPETQVLTKRGWLGYDDIADDEVLSLELESGEAVWSPILARLWKQPTDGSCWAIKGQAFDALMTDGHGILCARNNDYKHYQYSEPAWHPLNYEAIGNLPSTFQVPVAGKTSISKCDLSDDQITLAGWILTDGCFDTTSSGISIYQSKAAPSLDALLERMDLPFSLYKREREAKPICGRELVGKPLISRQYKILAAAGKVIRGYLPSKDLPFWAFDCDDRQFDILLNALVAGDGCWDGGHPERKTCAVLYGRKEFLDQAQAAAIAHGWRAHLAVAREKDWRLYFSRRTRIKLTSQHISVAQVPLLHWAWGLKTGAGNFMVRRNGKPYFAMDSRLDNIASAGPNVDKVTTLTFWKGKLLPPEFCSIEYGKAWFRGQEVK